MLERFGFSPTESRVYQALLQRGPSTGYAVALELGIARANVYQALEELVRRGAARKSATSPIQYVATGPAALVAELERVFKQDVRELEHELQSLPIAGSGAMELELLTTEDQLLARAASCVDVSTADVLVVSGEWAAALNARLEAAAARRIRVRRMVLDVPLADASARPVVVVSDRGRAVCGIVTASGTSGIATTSAGVVPFLRLLLAAGRATDSE